MRLDQFDCRGFRALVDQSFEPAPGLNVIRGHNAQGKTSVLEAVLFLATSKSHRTTAEGELVKHGEEGFHLGARAVGADREVRLQAHWWRGSKRFRVNGVFQTRVSDILGKLAVVLFSPDDIVLVKGTAAHRRKFLDMELSQINPVYLNGLQQYRQVLRQRNELLRGYSPDPDLLDVWDAQLAQAGAVLIRERDAFLGELGRLAGEVYGRITDGETLDLRYAPDTPPDVPLTEVLAQARASDLRRHMTTRGPHRDDIHMHVAGEAARSFASQGQQKTAALAVKLAEVSLVRARTGDWPVLMLDEALSELDAKRSRMLFGAIDDAVQCLVTTTNLGGLSHLVGPDATLFRIERGVLEKE
ncbi:MAG: DNA replication/repair protein RecF [Nitrospiraceae bacterium]|nr:DNA replication/repair protein RecF [Nitrospiraceae bacterium]